jgi:hypothetical protein
MVVVEKKKEFSCNSCPAAFGSKEHLEVHLMQNNGHKVECLKCHKRFDSFYDRQDHTCGKPIAQLPAKKRTKPKKATASGASSISSRARSKNSSYSALNVPGARGTFPFTSPTPIKAPASMKPSQTLMTSKCKSSYL